MRSATIIAAQRPGDAILGEEGGETQEGAGLRWIVDPLDGTVNFLFGVPQWCVSVAVHDDDGGVAGVVFDPLREELFAGRRGGGPADAQRRRRCAAPSSAELATALIGTGFAYDAGVRERAGAGHRPAAAARARRAPDGQRRARPRLDARPGATTRSTSAACRSGTSRRARAVRGAGLEVRPLARGRGARCPGVVVGAGGADRRRSCVLVR